MNRLTQEQENQIRALKAEWEYRGIGSVVSTLLLEIDALREDAMILEAAAHDWMYAYDELKTKYEPTFGSVE